jgi:hypothetical protein
MKTKTKVSGTLLAAVFVVLIATNPTANDFARREKNENEIDCSYDRTYLLLFTIYRCNCFTYTNDGKAIPYNYGYIGIMKQFIQTK